MSKWGLRCLFILGLGVGNVGFALASTPFGVDAHHQLTHEVQKDLAQMHTSFGNSKNIHIFTFVLHEEAATDKAVLIREKILDWELKYPVAATQAKVAFLVLNPPTRESWVVLGKGTAQTHILLDNIRTIREEIVAPALEAGEVDRSAFEGVTALTTVLDDWHDGMQAVPTTPFSQGGLIIAGGVFLLALGCAWCYRRMAFGRQRD